MKIRFLIFVLALCCAFSANAENFLVTAALGLSMLGDTAPPNEKDEQAEIRELEEEALIGEDADQRVSSAVSGSAVAESELADQAELVRGGKKEESKKEENIDIDIPPVLSTPEMEEFESQAAVQSADPILAANVVSFGSSVNRVRLNRRLSHFPENQKVPFIGNKIKLALTDNQEIMPEFTYSFSWGNFFSALSYESEALATIGTVDGFDNSQSGKNRELNTLKVYPINYSYRSRGLGIALGVFYVRRSIDRTEFGLLSSGESSGEQVNFNNELLMDYQQLGFQTSFLFQRNRFSVRSMFGVLPYNRLTVSENSLFRSVTDDANDISAKEKLGNAYTAQIDMLYRTSWYVDLLTMLSYDYWPSRYTKSVSLYDKKNSRASFASAEHDVDMGSAALAFAVLMPEISAFQLAPFVEMEFRQFSEADNITNKTLFVRTYAVSIGFSSKF